MSLLERVSERVAAVPARVGFYWEDLETGESLEINGHVRFPAASVIKIPIMLEVYRQAVAGKFSLGDAVKVRNEDKVEGAGVLQELHGGLKVYIQDLCRLMIVVSDNTATNLLIKKVGMDNVNSMMERLGMAGSHLGRLMMETPSPERDNWMTPADAARSLRECTEGKVIGATTLWAEENLARQQYREKIPLLLPEDARVLHKTGELDGVRHDAAIVMHPKRPYLLSLFTDKGGPGYAVDLALARISLEVWESLQ